MTSSLIITTYNSPKALELCLNSALNQNLMPDEIIIADDGSKEETKKLIEKFIKENPKLKIIHSWQENLGFRAAASRNKAGFKAKSEYLIYIDGDMILDENFIYDHVKNARKGYYLQGSRVLLSPNYTKEIFKKMRFKKPCLFSKKIKNNLNSLRSSFLSKFYSLFSKNSFKGTKSCNFSFFKKDFLKVNGFNEDFVTWGREDSEFIARLYNSGIKRKNLKFAGIQYHLYHKEGSSNSKNDAILQKAIDEKIKFCKNGVDKYEK